MWWLTTLRLNRLCNVWWYWCCCQMELALQVYVCQSGMKSVICKWESGEELFIAVCGSEQWCHLKRVSSNLEIRQRIRFACRNLADPCCCAWPLDDSCSAVQWSLAAWPPVPLVVSCIALQWKQISKSVGIPHRKIASWLVFVMSSHPYQVNITRNWQQNLEKTYLVSCHWYDQTQGSVNSLITYFCGTF